MYDRLVGHSARAYTSAGWAYPSHITSRSLAIPSFFATAADRVLPGSISEISRRRPSVSRAYSAAPRAASVARPRPQCARARR